MRTYTLNCPFLQKLERVSNCHDSPVNPIQVVFTIQQVTPDQKTYTRAQNPLPKILRSNHIVVRVPGGNPKRPDVNGTNQERVA